jgi:hypothetical protein
MKLFKVAAGTPALLLSGNEHMQVTQAYTIPHDMTFEREELLADPISAANKSNAELPPGSLGHDLASRGYCLFSPPQDMDTFWHDVQGTRLPAFILLVPDYLVEVMQ